MYVLQFLLFLAFLSALPCGMQAQQDSQSDITVLTFNIYHGETMRGDFDLDVIARVIIDAQPDLVALQEVDVRTNRARGMDLVTELALRTGMTPSFARAMPYDGGEYGEGILSRWTFIETRTIPLPYLPGEEPRAAALAVIVVPSGDTIAFMGTHLAHEGRAGRSLQARALVRELQGITMPVILAGDLNDTPGSEPINILESVCTPTYRPVHPAYTYPSHSPEKKIDYIMYAPDDRWKVMETTVIADSIASDHCAYRAILRLTPDRTHE
ncbi:MAG: endonuclease/exonuclease/phosphatase family protein [Saprospiraceae bacterium]|nr:endonuclease/exonuclease/phosphatase family protein [Saprospiraceae bacterium]